MNICGLWSIGDQRCPVPSSVRRLVSVPSAQQWPLVGTTGHYWALGTGTRDQTPDGFGHQQAPESNRAVVSAGACCQCMLAEGRACVGRQAPAQALLRVGGGWEKQGGLGGSGKVGVGEGAGGKRAGSNFLQRWPKSE